MGRFTTTIQKYAPVIESIMGNISDITVKNRYTDVLKSLQPFEKVKAEKDRFDRLLRMRRGVNLTTKDLTGPMTDFNIALDNPNFAGTETAKQYASTLTPTTNDAGETMAPPITADGIKQFIAGNPDAQKELAGLNLLQPVYSKLSDDQIEELKNKKAGFTPEDTAFYNEYKKKNFDTTASNQKLANIILDNYPGLISRGSAKDLFAKLYMQKAGNLEIPGVLPPDYSFLNLNNGQVMRTTKQGDYEIIDVNPKQKKNPIDNPDNWQVEERDGKYYWAYDNYDPGTGNTELKVIRELSNTEREKYLREKETGDIKFNNLKNPKRPGRRGGSKNISPEQAFITSAVKTMSELGMKNNALKSDWSKWEKEDRDSYTNAMTFLQKKLGITKEQAWDVVGYWEKHGTLPSEYQIQDMTDNNDTEDDSVDFTYDNWEKEFDNVFKTSSDPLAWREYYEYYKQNEKDINNVKKARNHYLKKVGAK